MKTKQWQGTKVVKRAGRREMVGASFRADKLDMDKLQKISDYWGWTQVKVVRLAIKVIIAMAIAQRRGKKEITLKLKG